MKKKLLIIAAANNFNFIRDIGEALREEFDVEFFPSDIHDAVAHRDTLYNKVRSADVVWLEWADGLPLQVLNSYSAKFILRIHRYELFKQRTLDAIATIDPSKVHKLLFVSDYVKQIGVAKFPWMERGVSIPNLIDVDKFPFHHRRRGYNLLLLGRISYVKNLPIALNFFSDLVWMNSHDPYHLHIVGDISDPELFYYQDNFLKKAGIQDRVTFHGRIPNEDLPSIMNQMHYILSTSVFESQGVGILEAMATGLKPVVYSFGGAESFFPEKYLFLNENEFFQRIVENYYIPAEYRHFVRERYSIMHNLWRYADVIREVANG